MIYTMTNLLVGEDNSEDIRRYGRLVALFGIAMIANNVRAEVIIPSDLEPMPVNMYGFGLAGSGLSKTRSVNYMLSWIEDAWKDIKQLGIANIEMLDPFNVDEIQDLTKDGVSVENFYKSVTDSSMTKLMRVLDITDYGSINYICDEFASVIGRDYEVLSSSILEIFDKGKVPVNLRSTSKTKKAENPIPMCMLSFGSPHLLFEADANTEKLFLDVLQAGLARRSIFVNVTTKVNTYTLELDEHNRREIESIKDRFRQIVTKYDHKVIPCSDEAKRLFKEAHDYDIQRSVEISDFKLLQKIYARNFHWLALKLSGIVAISNLHDEVTGDDYKFALEIIEDSYNDLISLLNRPEKYEVVVNYLLDKGTTESEYTLTKELPFYKDIKSKRQFLELAKGYAYNNNITLQIQDRQNVTFYSARGKVKTDLSKPLMFSYSQEMTEGYYTNDEIKWEDFHKVLTTEGICYSAHSFKDGYRKSDNAITGFQLVILDIDDGVPLDTAKVLFDDYTYLIATTRSHQKDKKGLICDRYRIILPMEYALDLEPDTYSKMMNNLYDDLPIDVDRATKDIARFYYSSKDAEYYYNEGSLINCDKYIDYTQEKELYDKEGVKLAKKNISGISQYIIRNQYNGRNNALVKLALLLMDSGYTHEECEAEVKRVNKQFDNPLSENELDRTVIKTMRRKEEKVVEEETYSYDNYEEDDPFSNVDY